MPAAIAAVDKPTTMGNASKTRTMMMAPGMVLPYWLEGPGFDLDGPAKGQRRHTNRAARRTACAETGHIRLVKGGEGIHIGKKAQRLFHVIDRQTHRRKLRLQIHDRLCSLLGDTTGDDLAINNT